MTSGWWLVAGGWVTERIPPPPPAYSSRPGRAQRAGQKEAVGGSRVRTILASTAQYIVQWRHTTTLSSVSYQSDEWDTRLQYQALNHTSPEDFPSCLQCCGAKCSNSTQRFYHKLLTVLGTMELLHCAILLAVIIQGKLLYWGCCEKPVNSLTISIEGTSRQSQRS